MLLKREFTDSSTSTKSAFIFLVNACATRPGVRLARVPPRRRSMRDRTGADSWSRSRGSFAPGALTAIEYALIASLIAVVIIGAVQVVGTKVSGVFSTVGNAL